MTDDPRHPHLAAGYFTQAEPADMAARPQTIDPSAEPMTSAGNATEVVTVTTDPTMLPGEAYEEMTAAELRKRAAARGVEWRGVRKAALIKALRD